MRRAMRLLLISASTEPRNMSNILGNAKRIAFVTFAQPDPAAVLEWARKRREYDMKQALWPADLAGAEAIFVCGGNTFLLLKMLYERSMIEPIRRLVYKGIPYIGASAGANIAAPTIKTTNDMPIVAPPTLDALGLIPFQINPHYPHPDVKMTPLGATRADRLREYVYENDIPVIGLREPSAIQVVNGEATLLGKVKARLFRKDAEAELAPGPIRIAMPGRRRPGGERRR